MCVYIFFHLFFFSFISSERPFANLLSVFIVVHNYVFLFYLVVILFNIFDF